MIKSFNLYFHTFFLNAQNEKNQVQSTKHLINVLHYHEILKKHSYN